MSQEAWKLEFSEKPHLISEQLDEKVWTMDLGKVRAATHTQSCEQLFRVGTWQVQIARELTSNSLLPPPLSASDGLIYLSPPLLLPNPLPLQTSLSNTPSTPPLSWNNSCHFCFYSINYVAAKCCDWLSPESCLWMTYQEARHKDCISHSYHIFPALPCSTLANIPMRPPSKYCCSPLIYASN